MCVFVWVGAVLLENWTVWVHIDRDPKTSCTAPVAARGGSTRLSQPFHLLGTVLLPQRTALAPFYLPRRGSFRGTDGATLQHRCDPATQGSVTPSSVQLQVVSLQRQPLLERSHRRLVETTEASSQHGKDGRSTTP